MTPGEFADEMCDGSKGCSLCNPTTGAEHVFRKRERFVLKGKRPGERGARKPWHRRWANAEMKTTENRRGRARQRNAMQRGVTLPLRDAPGRRWDSWNWD